MNERSDIDRTLRHWLVDGPSEMPDRVVDGIAARIARQPQRRTWRLQGRPFMNTYAKLASAAAAMIVVGFIGWKLLPANGGIGGEATPAPTPTFGAATAPTATHGSGALPEGRITVDGRYRLRLAPDHPTLAIDADVSAGWSGAPAAWAVMGPNTEKPPGGIGLFVLVPNGLFEDPCHWNLDGTGNTNQAGNVAVGPSVDDLVTALQAYTLTASARKPVTFGAYSGTQLEVQLPANLDGLACDQSDGSSRYVVFAGPLAGFYAQGNDSRWRVTVVDVGGTRVVVLMSFFPGTPATDVAAGQAIVDSIEFTP